MSKKKEAGFEERLSRLEAIVRLLEAGDRPLEESVLLYKEGLGHSAACRDLLATARHDIQLLDQGQLVPFDLAASEEEHE